MFKGINIASLGINIPIFIIFLMVIPPITSLIWFSFTQSINGETVFTTYNFMYIFSSPITIRSLTNSFLVAFISALIATLIGTVLAFAITRTDVPLVTKLEPLIIVPLILSPFMLALAWASMLDPHIGTLSTVLNLKIDIYSIEGIILVTTVAAVPLVYMTTKSFFDNFDATLEEAAIISGANVSKALFHITFRLAMPTLFSAFFWHLYGPWKS